MEIQKRLAGKYQWIALVLLMIGALGGDSGCNQSSSTAQEDMPVKHSAVVTVYPMESLVRDVAGERIDRVWTLDWFCENGLDPRDLTLTDEQLRFSRRCDLAFTSGFEETWAGDMLNSQERSRQVVNPAITTAGMLYKAHHGALWLDMQVMKQFIEQARERLTLLDPKGEGAYRKNAQAVTQELDALESEYRDKLGPLWGKQFLSLRRTWDPMVLRFGLKEIAPVDTDPQKLNEEEVRTLKQAAKEKGVQILAIDSALLPGVRRELELRTGLKLMPLDLVGTSAPDGRSTYARIMHYNLSELVKDLP